jgi:hypothetical protein
MASILFIRAWLACGPVVAVQQAVWYPAYRRADWTIRGVNPISGRERIREPR